jgi:hypothetical protein
MSAMLEQPMSDSFHLLDLISQARAVADLLRGRSHEAKIAWLAAHGQLRRRQLGSRDIYDFRSGVGHECVFLLDQEQFVFLGDHTTFTV